MTAAQTAQEARDRSLKRYFTGKPCRNGHIADRLASNGTCLDCSNERLKTWSRSNRDKINANVQRHIDRDPKRYREKRLQYQIENRDRIMQAHRNWAAKNRDKTRRTRSQWKKRNPDQVAAARNKRRALAARAYPAWANAGAIKALYAEAAKLSRETGTPHHVDHIIPLINQHVCGLHVETNLRVIAAAENYSKNNRFRPELLEAAR